jgi:hypothetical protein
MPEESVANPQVSIIERTPRLVLISFFQNVLRMAEKAYGRDGSCTVLPRLSAFPNPQTPYGRFHRGEQC